MAFFKRVSALSKLLSRLSYREITLYSSYWEITSDSYLDFIKDYVVGIGSWKDTIVPITDNYLNKATDLVAKAHSRGQWPLLVEITSDNYSKVVC